jgi:predicted ribosomally synthesized peptide with nif11-like leader
MSTENIHRFTSAISTDSALREKIKGVKADSPQEAAEQVAALAREAGIDISAEEVIAACDPEIPEENLETVSGGVGPWDPEIIDMYKNPGPPPESPEDYFRRVARDLKIIR